MPPPEDSDAFDVDGDFVVPQPKWVGDVADGFGFFGIRQLSIVEDSFEVVGAALLAEAVLANKRMLETRPDWVVELDSDGAAGFAPTDAVPSSGPESGGFDGPIVGLGVGIDPNATDADAMRPVLLVSTRVRMTDVEVRDLLARQYGFPSASSLELPVVPLHTGAVRFLSHRIKRRPAPGGVSCGHVRTSAGTIGARVGGRSGARANQSFLLSNNHVLARFGTASPGDPIIQPARGDRGKAPQDTIAKLAQYVSVSPTEENVVDAAVALAGGGTLSGGIYQTGPAASVAVSNIPLRAQPGMAVKKSGRTTGVTSGLVISTNAQVLVQLQRFTLPFVGQIQISGIGPKAFSKGGDSGALVWTDDAGKNPVGLLFGAGIAGNVSAYANPIGAVLQALDIVLDL